MKRALNPRLGAVIVATALVLSFKVAAQQGGSATVAIDGDDIGGVVTSAKGPEAGVWVIGETTDLPTKFAKMVVTDDQGRYVVPDLPAGELSGVRSRVRAGGFSACRGKTRSTPGSEGCRRA
jgi:hypothetical protein